MKNVALWIGCMVLSFAITAAGQNGSRTTASTGKSGMTRTVATAVRDVPADSFVIGTGDVLAIDVWKETEMSRVVPVRSDGRISLPLIGELQAGGQTPKQLEKEIATKLKDYISEPEVTVIVQEIKSQKFNVLGMVMRPGSYTLTKPMTVMDAIAMAGGLRDFAKQKDIYVLRRTARGQQLRLPFNYKDVVKGHNSAQNVELESNDTLVIP